MALTALLTTTTVCILCLMEFPREANSNLVPGCTLAPGTPPPHLSPTIFTSLSGFATIIYAFGGAPIFPSIQADMTDRSQFKYSVIASHGSKFLHTGSIWNPAHIAQIVRFGRGKRQRKFQAATRTGTFRAIK